MTTATWPLETMTTTNDSLKLPSTRTSFSSSQTIIEPEQQQQLQLQLQPNSQDNIQLQPENYHHQVEDRAERRTVGESEDSEDEDHDRRLRLIEVNRTLTRLADEEQDLPPPASLAQNPTGPSPPTTLLSADIQPHQRSKEPLESTIPLEILLSPNNQKKAFHFDHLLTIADLINHLLHHWPSDWCQDGLAVPHHVNQFRMVYMGRFLDNQETLNSLGKIRPIIIHLVIKPDAGIAQEEEVDEDKAGLCGCWRMFRGRSSRPANYQGSFGACVIV